MPTTYSAFFYGTLLHPRVLRRVIGHPGHNLSICPALLLEHTRHQVKYADYPGVIPYNLTRQLLNRELSPEERLVRGTVVIGLTDEDIDLLDVFEGNEYTRENVSVHPLSPFISLLDSEKQDSSVVPTHAPDIPPLDSLPNPITVQTYIWAQPLSQLKPDLWDYDEFVRTNAWKWIDSNADRGGEYVEVDRRKEMNGYTMRTAIIDESTGGQDGLTVIGEKLDTTASG